MDRRSFVSGAFGGGTSVALSEVIGFSNARAANSSGVCEVVEGPIKEALPDLRQLAEDPQYQQFLSDLDPLLEQLASIPVPAVPSLKNIRPTAEELKSVGLSIEQAIESVLADLPADQRPSLHEIRQINREARDLVTDFLNASRTDLLARTDLTVPILE